MSSTISYLTEFCSGPPPKRHGFHEQS